jgi:ABC-type hemin transport system ATPase subunit
MTLLLGPPQSGKSTVLKALSGRLHPSGLNIQGNVSCASAALLTSLLRTAARACLVMPPTVPCRFGQSSRTVHQSAGCCPTPDACCLVRHR